MGVIFWELLITGEKMKDKLYCACNGKECEGICRKLHLNRKRDWTEPKNRCPEAYEKRVNNGK